MSDVIAIRPGAPVGAGDPGFERLKEAYRFRSAIDAPAPKQRRRRFIALFLARGGEEFLQAHGTEPDDIGIVCKHWVDARTDAQALELMGTKFADHLGWMFELYSWERVYGQEGCVVTEGVLKVVQPN